jgi:phosphatidate cytidylyltransferase
MSPHEALHSPVFAAYCIIVVGLLMGSGVIIAFLEFVVKKKVRTVWLTYRSWWIMAPLAAAFLFAGRVPTILGLSVIALLGFKEFARATGLYQDWWMTGAVYAGIAAVCVTCLVRHPGGDDPVPGWYGLFMAVPVYVIALILLIPILRDRTEHQLQAVSLAILGFIYIGWMFGHLAFLTNPTHAYGYVLYLLFAVQVNDVAAFTFGRIIGRRPLRKNISPNKTWEGALGAVAVSLVLPWLLRFSFPHFAAKQLIFAGLIVGIGGQLGDLSISVIKRDIGIKDMGAGIPGHGGVLDRIDSLIYTAPLFMHMVDYYYGLN